MDKNQIKELSREFSNRFRLTLCKTIDEFSLDGFFEQAITRTLELAKAIDNADKHRAKLQTRIFDWVKRCFGKQYAKDHEQRNHRFLEEALELVQACGYREDKAISMVRYVYSRPKGEVAQEIGGVFSTLSALASNRDLDILRCAETELARCERDIEKIRAKMQKKHAPGEPGEYQGLQGTDAEEEQEAIDRLAT